MRCSPEGVRAEVLLARGQGVDDPAGDIGRVLSDRQAGSLAGRPIAGQAPRLPTGKDPADVARRIVDALAAGEHDLGADAFG